MDAEQQNDTEWALMSWGLGLFQNCDMCARFCCLNGKEITSEQLSSLCQGELIEVGVAFTPGSSWNGTVEDFIDTFTQHAKRLKLHFDLYNGDTLINRELSIASIDINQDTIESSRKNDTFVCPLSNGVFVSVVSLLQIPVTYCSMKITVRIFVNVLPLTVSYRLRQRTVEETAERKVRTLLNSSRYHAHSIPARQVDVPVVFINPLVVSNAYQSLTPFVSLLLITLTNRDPFNTLHIVDLTLHMEDTKMITSRYLSSSQPPDLTSEPGGNANSPLPLGSSAMPMHGGDDEVDVHAAAPWFEHEFVNSSCPGANPHVSLSLRKIAPLESYCCVYRVEERNPASRVSSLCSGAAHKSMLIPAVHPTTAVRTTNADPLAIAAGADMPQAQLAHGLQQGEVLSNEFITPYTIQWKMEKLLDKDKEGADAGDAGACAYPGSVLGMVAAAKSLAKLDSFEKLSSCDMMLKNRVRWNTCSHNSQTDKDVIVRCPFQLNISISNHNNEVRQLQLYTSPEKEEGNKACRQLEADAVMQTCQSSAILGDGLLLHEAYSHISSVTVDWHFTITVLPLRTGMLSLSNLHILDFDSKELFCLATPYQFYCHPEANSDHPADHRSSTGQAL